MWPSGMNTNKVKFNESEVYSFTRHIPRKLSRAYGIVQIANSGKDV